MASVADEFRTSAIDFNIRVDEMKKELEHLGEAQKMYNRLMSRQGIAEHALGKSEDLMSVISLESDRDSDSESVLRADNEKASQDEFFVKRSHPRQKRHVSFVSFSRNFIIIFTRDHHHSMNIIKSKNQSSLYSGYYPVTSGGIHLCDLAPGQHRSEETSQRWRHCI